MSNLDFHQRWIEINPDALANNVRVLKSSIGSAKLMAVVKANAYGHDAKLVSPILRDAGADAFGVTTLDEACELLNSGIDPNQTPILMFAPITDQAAAERAIETGLSLTICDFSSLEIAELAEKKVGKTAKLHLKVDTGMGRLGLSPDKAAEIVNSRSNWDAIYTHFANASLRSARPTLNALKEFNRFVAQSRKRKGVEIATCHCANTAAALRFPNTRLDMVRIGTAIYGQMPSEFVPKPSGLSDDTFALKARILQVKELRRGDTVGYGSEFRAKSAMRVAVVAVGLADGFGTAPTSLYSGLRGLSRVLKSGSNPLFVKLDGKALPVLGRVAMQMVVVDVSDAHPSLEAGSVVDVPIRRLAASAAIPRVCHSEP